MNFLITDMEEPEKQELIPALAEWKLNKDQ